MDNAFATTSALGLIVILVILGVPMYILFFTTMFGGPRVGRVRGVFVGTVALLLVSFVVSTFIFSGLMSLIVPD